MSSVPPDDMDCGPPIKGTPTNLQGGFKRYTCPPGYTDNGNGLCIPNCPPNQPSPGNGNGQGPSFQPSYNCGTAADGSTYPQVAWLYDRDLCGSDIGYPQGYTPIYILDWGKIVPPPSPGFPPDCNLTWYAESCAPGTSPGMHQVSGTWQQWLAELSAETSGKFSITTPQAADHSVCCPPPAPPVNMPPCQICGSDYSGSSCGNCTPTINTQPIADAITALVNKLNNQTLDCDKISSDCLGQIAKQVKELIDEEGPTCDECCQMISSGASMSASDAIICANCGCEEIEKGCSFGLGAVNGDVCDTCGEEVCCCENGECVPCPPQQQPQQFIGWYNCVTGETAVGKAGSVAFGEPWIPTGPVEDEAAALEAAEASLAYCATNPQQPTPPLIPVPTSPVPPGCDIFQFGSPDSAGQFMLGLSGSQALLSFEVVAINAAKAVIQTVADELGAPVGGYQIAQTVLGPITAGFAMAPLVANLVGCGNGATVQGMSILSALGAAGQLAGIDFTKFTPQVEYAIHAACRNRQLSPDSAMSAFLAGQIDYSTLDTHWGIQGYCPQSVQWAANASRSKPIPGELIQLLNRGVISSGDFGNRMRMLGYTDPNDVNMLQGLGQIVPPYSDIVRMMVRDTDDQALVDRFGLDTDFTTKYQPQLQQWAKAQGVPDKVMQYLWRAHWSIPAPGQLFEMYHRLRHAGTFGTEAEVLADVTTALEQQDILPFWIPRLLAISFRPLTRVDARRAYQIGAIDDNGLYDAYIQGGYSDANATILLNFTKRLKTVGIRNEPAIKLWVAGAIDANSCRNRLAALSYTQSDITFGMADASIQFANGADAKAFVAGEITRADLVTALFNRGVDNAAANAIADKLANRITYNPAIDEYEAGTVDRAAAVANMVQDGLTAARANYFANRIDGRLRIAAARNCQVAVRRQFLTGGLSSNQAQASLVSSGIVAERASVVVQRWQCELSARTRQPSISMLCRWLAEGSVAPDQFLTRAQRLGFSPDDASAVLLDCQGKINYNRMQQALSQAKGQAAAAAKAARLAAREEAAILKNAQQLTRARQLRAEAVSRREKLLMTLADNIQALCGCGIQSSVQTASDAVARASAQPEISYDDAIEIATRAVASWDGVSEAALMETIDALVGLYVAQFNAAQTPDDAHPFIASGAIQP